jgi:TonB family protein
MWHIELQQIDDARPSRHLFACERGVMLDASAPPRLERKRSGWRITALTAVTLSHFGLVALVLLSHQQISLVDGLGDATPFSEVSISLMPTMPEHKLQQQEHPAVPHNAPNPAQTAALPKEATSDASAASAANASTTMSATVAASNFRDRLYNHIVAYARAARVARHSAHNAAVIFTMNRAGTVLEIRLLQSSGNEQLDQATIDTVLRAQPLPAIPEDLPDPLQIELPIDFDGQR